MVYVTVIKLNVYRGTLCGLPHYSNHYFSRKQSTSWVLFPLKHISRCKLFSGQAETITQAGNLTPCRTTLFMETTRLLDQQQQRD